MNNIGGYIAPVVAWDNCPDCGLSRQAITKQGRKQNGSACLHCGKHFHQRRAVGHNGEKALCCSHACAGVALLRKADTETGWTHWWFRDCAICGSRFVTNNRAVRLCQSRKCRLKEMSNRSLAEAKAAFGPPRPMICQECGREWTKEYGDQRREFCSNKCSRKDNHRMRKLRTSRHLENRPRFAKVYDKANGKCQICGLPCDRKLQVPHPLAPTMDHVWPVSEHGKHNHENVQLAHFFCNCAKGARLNLTDAFRSALAEEITRQLVDAHPDWRFIAKARREDVLSAKSVASSGPNPAYG